MASTDDMDPDELYNIGFKPPEAAKHMPSWYGTHTVTCSILLLTLVSCDNDSCEGCGVMS